jgi:hypothetical protein
MNLEDTRREIARMRTQVQRQRKDIQSLEKVGISTKSAHELLERMQFKIDQLCADRDRMVGEKRVKYAGTERAIRGPQIRYRSVDR